MNISEAIAKRKSVRAYLDKPVPANDLAKIVEAGQWAPNAGAFQISVVRNAGLRQRINDRTLDAMVHSDNEFLQQRASLPGYQPIYGAPVLILLSAPANAPFSAVNTALAAENMLLEATGLGLGSCHIITPTLALNGENNRDLAREAGLPDGYVVQCAVIVGYAAAENKFTVGERTRKGSVNYVDWGYLPPWKWEAKVVRFALQNAASVASLLITTEAVVAEKPKKEEAGPPMPPEY